MSAPQRQSIFGALLTAGYAAALGAAIAASPDKDQVTAATQSQLTKSFDSASALAAQYPQYSQPIISAAKTSFLQGDRWAYTAGLVAVLTGAVLVFFLFPKKEEESSLLAGYQATARPTSEARPTAPTAPTAEARPLSPSMARKDVEAPRRSSWFLRRRPLR